MINTEISRVTIMYPVRTDVLFQKIYFCVRNDIICICNIILFVIVMVKWETFDITTLCGCKFHHILCLYIDGLVQKRHNCSTFAMELCLSCTNPSMYALYPFLISSYNDIYGIFLCQQVLHQQGCWVPDIYLFIYLFIRLHPQDIVQHTH